MAQAVNFGGEYSIPGADLLVLTVPAAPPAISDEFIRKFGLSVGYSEANELAPWLSQVQIVGTNLTGFVNMALALAQASPGGAIRLAANAGDMISDSSFALSAGFGSTASITHTTGSVDSRGQLTVTCTGSGLAANPTITYTFTDGTFPNPPFAVACRGGSAAGQNQLTVHLLVDCTSTTLKITFLGTPQANDVYIINWFVLG